MLKKIAFLAILYASAYPSASIALGHDLSKADNLVLRFTGSEAQKLTSFLKDRFRKETDYDQTRYYGDRMSLACSEQDDCYLWLTRKEWQMEGSGNSLNFTLPLKQSTWTGQLSLSEVASQNESMIRLELKDLYYPGTFSFTKALKCPVIKGAEPSASLHGDGDCRLEFSSSPKKGLPYAPSIQFVHNLDNIIVNFKGPWAGKLFASANASEVDPHDSKRLRAQLGPSLYCWNLDPLDQERFLDDSYVCQTKLLRQDGDKVHFSSQGSMKGNKDFTLTLTPIFRKGMLKDFDLHLHAEDRNWIITHCPNYAKNAGFGQCGIFYDLKMDAGLYPIGNSVQGVAVGWGVVKQAVGNNRG
jgi:hypothetical protein